MSADTKGSADTDLKTRRVAELYGVKALTGGGITRGIDAVLPVVHIGGLTSANVKSNDENKAEVILVICLAKTIGDASVESGGYATSGPNNKDLPPKGSAIMDTLGTNLDM